MSNIKKIGLDYFSIDTDIFSDEKMQYITAKFGVKGEAIIFRLMARIYRQGYYYQWNDDQCLLLSMSTGGSATAELIQEVVEEATKRGFFNEKMYKKYGILTSKRIQKHYLFSTRRRKVVDMVSTFILVDFHDADILNENVSIKELNVGNSPTKHSIEQHSKEKKKEICINYSADFLIFWDKYPKKKAKPKAFESYKKVAKTVPLDTLLKAIESQTIEKKYLQESGKFCPDWPHPTTWLNQGRWEDEVTTISQAPTPRGTR